MVDMQGAHRTFQEAISKELQKMKFTVFYGRKVRVAAYDMLEIALTQEFDTAETRIPEAFNRVRGYVDEWVEKERDRLLEKSVPRPETEQRGQK